ncbi:MAG: GNAT family N-acetyltransferase [Faecousia sp.]
MLVIAESLAQLDFDALMEIYVEGNREHGAECWPEKPEKEQLALSKQDFRRYLEEQFFPKSGAVYAVWEADGKYVSALRLEPNRDGLLMETLETIPDQRRKGYAVTLIRAVQSWLREQGKGKVYSHVNKCNCASLQTHERCGFHRFLDHVVCFDGSVNYNTYTMLCEEA